MKLKKILAGVSAAALAASMSCAFSASAITLGADKIDFEDGDFSFVYINNDEPGKDSGGSDDSKLSVEEYEGSKQLKVDVQKCGNVPKVWFDMDKIMPRASSITVKQIDFDVTFVPKDSTKQLGWMGGAVGVAGGFDMNLPGKGQKNPSWSDGSWDCADENLYVDGGIAKAHITRKMLLPTQQWSEKSVNPFFGFMTWANQNDCEYVIYIDNITFSDGSKTITVGLPAVEETTVAEETTAAPAEETTAAPAETEAAPAETTAAPAETEAPATEAAPAETTAAPVETTAAPVETTAAAPAVDTTVPATGNTAAASIVAVMAVAGAAALVSKKRK